MAKFYFKKWPNFTLRNGEIAICGFKTTQTMDDNCDNNYYSLSIVVFDVVNLFRVASLKISGKSCSKSINMQVS